ncbi:MAG: aspartate aminotransferase family protein [Alphaproteobacteria bacterium]|nr:aspartate aminotransferase family protein [Alphaproteobacteria bacterium]
MPTVEGGRGNSPASRDIDYVMHPYTNLDRHKQTGPMIIERGDGVYVWDDSGRRYIEAMAGLWCTSLGFNEERLVEAAARQMRELPYYHVFAHKSTMPVIDLAEKLIALAPVPMSKVFFANSGSEANDTVVKMVWYYNNALGRPDKKKIISRIKGYHGVTVASASMTGLPYNHKDFDLPIANILHADCPHYWLYGEEGESEEDFATRMAANLEKMILDEGPDTVAAFIAEPIMGAGGVILPPRTYFEKIQPILKKYDILMIADEVICGFGRTGNMWGSQTFDVWPDILTCAKALSSAYLPISAVMVNEAVASVISANAGKLGTFGHGYTYTGHPVSAAVALETLAIYEERDIVSHVRAVAPRLQNGLRQFADHPLVGEVRGTGLVAAVHLVKDKQTKEMFDPAIQAAPTLFSKVQAHGVITRAIGMDAVSFSPPLIISAEQLDAVVDAFGKGLDETWDWMRAEGHV